jgi:hypothetical protein
MKHLAAALLATCALAVSASALACDRAAYDKRYVKIDARRLPADMTKAAARIDVAVAEAVEPIDVDAFLTQAWAAELARAGPAEAERIARVRKFEEQSFRLPSFGRIRFRVEETLKGQPAAGFTLMGRFGFEGSPFAARRDEFESALEQGFPRGDYSQPEAVYRYERMVQADIHEPASCTTFPTAIAGRRYLIFRDAEGRLLGEIVEPGRRYGGNLHQWPVYVPLRANDPWLARVRKTVREAR